MNLTIGTISFPFSVKPMRVGVYAVVSDLNRCTHFSKWDGEKWCRSCDTPDRAGYCTIQSNGVYDGMYNRWFGLTVTVE